MSMSPRQDKEDGAGADEDEGNRGRQETASLKMGMGQLAWEMK